MPISREPAHHPAVTELGRAPAGGKEGSRHGIRVSRGFIPLAWNRSPHERARSCRLFDDFIPGIPPMFETGIEHHEIAVTESFQ